MSPATVEVPRPVQDHARTVAVRPRLAIAGLENATFIRIAGLLAAIGVSSRLFGLVREAAIAGRFGVGSITDTWSIAETFAVLVPTLIGGALATALVPGWHRVAVRDGEGAARDLAATLLTWVVVIGLGATLLLVAAGPGGLPVLYAGLGAESMSLLGRMVVLAAPAALLVLLTEVVTGLASANGVFLVPAVGSLVVNATVALVLLLPVELGPRALVLAFVVGHGLAFVLAFASVAMRLRPRFRHPALAGVLGAALPILLLRMGGLLRIPGEQILAARSGTGSVAALGFAMLTVAAATGIVSHALHRSLYPRLSARIADGDLKGVRALMGRALAVDGVLGCLVAAGGVLFGPWAVACLFERGAFGPEATRMTALAVSGVAVAAAPGLVAESLRLALVAAGAFRTVVIGSLLGTGLGLAASAALAGPMGLRGIALGAGVGTFAAIVPLGIAARRRGLVGW